MKEIDLNKRINAFVELGSYIKDQIARLDDGSELNDVIRMANNKNVWFDQRSVVEALDGIASWLNTESLVEWVSYYTNQISSERESQVVAIVMAGNIPAVGFHDLLCVLIAGHHAQVKLSSDDDVVIPYLVKQLIQIEPGFKDAIVFKEGFIQGFKGVIATGSNNTARYFEKYFKGYPSIIRGNRNSVALVTGKETEEEILRLGQDIFAFYGLGCRSISQIWFPKNFDYHQFFEPLTAFNYVVENSKYMNNLDYNKALMLVNREKFLDGGFALLRPSKSVLSPISVINYVEYEDVNEFHDHVKKEQNNIQVVVGPGYQNYGVAQKPELSDYADKIDTMKFLLEL